MGYPLFPPWGITPIFGDCCLARALTRWISRNPWCATWAATAASPDFSNFKYQQQKFPSSSLSSDMVGIIVQGVSQKKYQTSSSRVLRRKLRGCIFVQCCGSLYGQIWKGTVWSNHGSLFTHGHSTANIQGKTRKTSQCHKTDGTKKTQISWKLPSIQSLHWKEKAYRAHVNQPILAASG